MYLNHSEYITRSSHKSLQHLTGGTCTTELLDIDSIGPFTSTGTSFSAGRNPLIDAKHIPTRSKNDALVMAATKMLEQQDVTQFYTMTFARRLSVEAARHRFMEWIDALEWFQRRPLGWLRAEETKRSPGLGTPAIPLHFHGVLIAAPHLNIRQAEALARELAGDTQVQPYQPGGGAIPYCLKHAFEESGHYDIGGKKAFRQFVPSSQVK